MYTFLTVTEHNSTLISLVKLPFGQILCNPIGKFFSISPLRYLASLYSNQPTEILANSLTYLEGGPLVQQLNGMWLSGLSIAIVNDISLQSDISK